MKNNKKILSSLLVASALYIYSSTLWANCSLSEFLATAPGTSIFSGWSSTTATASFCGNTVTFSSTGSLSNVNTTSNLGFAVTTSQIASGQLGTTALTAPLTITVNGVVIFSGTSVTQAQAQLLLSTLGVISVQQNLSAVSLASTSASAKIGDTVFHSIISPSMQTRSQQVQQQNRPMQKLIMTFADLKYERANFNSTNDRGNIGGFSASGSYDINRNFSVGAIVPYDHLAFNSFDADRTGTIVYVKNTLKLPSNFELSTAVNGNYMYTATQFDGISGTNSLHTYGGGASTRLKYDHIDTNFIPSIAFSYQYNKDNTHTQDDQQHAIKLGPSLGYRVLDNATVQVSGSWTKDISQYKQLQNGNDFYDAGIEGAWAISDAWQLRGGYKKILGLTNYTSDSIYLGSAIKF